MSRVMPQMAQRDAESAEVLYRAGTIVQHLYRGDPDGVAGFLLELQRWAARSGETFVRGELPRFGR